MSKFIHTLFVGVVLLGLSVPVYAQANDVDCIRCVDTRDIAPEAVNSYKIKPKAVTTDKLSKQAVTTSKLAPQAVTTGKIQDGAVTSDKLSPELSDSIQATESAVDALETKRGVLDQNELTSIWSNSLNAHFDLVKIGNDLYTCGQSYLYGCDRAISADGTEFGGLEYYPGTASVSFFDPIAFTYVSAIPTDIVAGYGELRFVGVANLAAHRNQGQMLVDDCDNPTVGYVQLSRNPRGHSPPHS
jgi:hypothetical protein